MKRFYYLLIAVIVVLVQAPIGVLAKGPTCVDENPYSAYSGSDYTGVVSLTVDFDASYSLACEGEIVDYSWDFGDGTVANGVTPTHTFTGGDWPVILTVQNTAGFTDTYTRTIVVRDTNNNPVAVDDSVDFYTRYDANSQTTATYYSGASSNDSDSDDDYLTYSVNTQPSNGYAQMFSSGTFTYTPNDGFFGTDTFEYQVQDQFDGYDIATVSVNVLWQNGSVYANSNYANATEDEVITVDVLANDVDTDGDPLSVELSSFNQSYGNAWVNPDNTISFLPTAEKYYSNVHIWYIASDAYGAQSSSYLSVAVASVNDAPKANDDTLVVDEDGGASFFIMTNDTDVDSTTLTSEILSTTTHGTLDYLGSGRYRYIPYPEYNGTDSFTYRVSDGDKFSEPATVYVTVNAVYDPLVVNPESITLDEDTSFNGNVLINDSWETASVIVDITAQPAHGSVTMDAEGNYAYTPTANYFGPDSFSYNVNDGVTTQSATVSIYVKSVNDAPIADFTYDIGRRRTVTFDASGSYDLEGSLNYHWNFGDGTSYIGKTASRSYKKGTYTVTLTVTDQSGASSIKQLDVTL